MEDGIPRIRAATQDDVESIAQIASTLYPKDFDGREREPLTEAILWINDNFPKSIHSALFVAAHNNSLVGYAHSRVTAHAAGVVVVDEFGAIKVEGVRGTGTSLILNS